MTTLREAREAIYKRFIDEWGSLTPYTFDNEEFDPPGGLDGRGVPWARCSVREITSEQQTLGPAGNRKFLRTALAKVDVFVPPASGRWDSDEYTMAARALFEGRTSPLGTTICFFGVDVQEVGLIEDGRWDLSTISARFDYTEIK